MFNASFWPSSGLTPLPSRDVVAQIVRVAGSGVDVLTSFSVNTATRGFWVAAECVVGVKLGNAAGLKLVCSP